MVGGDGVGIVEVGDEAVVLRAILDIVDGREAMVEGEGIGDGGVEAGVEDEAVGGGEVMGGDERSQDVVEVGADGGVGLAGFAGFVVGVFGVGFGEAGLEPGEVGVPPREDAEDVGPAAPEKAAIESLRALSLRRIWRSMAAVATVAMLSTFMMTEPPVWRSELPWGLQAARAALMASGVEAWTWMVGTIGATLGTWDMGTPCKG